MEIPDKIFFKIGEVSEIADVKPYVLRYWESEFSLSPSKSGSGQRLYRRKDIEKILLIKKLLYNDGFTIAGARKHLSKMSREEAQAAVVSQLTVPAAELPAGPGPAEPEPSSDAVLDALMRDDVPEPQYQVDPEWLSDVMAHALELRALIRAARGLKLG